MIFSISDPVILKFIASSLFFKIKNNEIIDDDTLQALYNSVVIDAIRSTNLTKDDEPWIREIIFSTTTRNKLLLNYLLNFHQVFIRSTDREKLFDLLKSEKQIALCFLISKLDVSVEEIQTLYDFIINNWENFVQEETYYENPYDYNFANFQNSLNKRVDKMTDIGLNKLWIYILSVRAILGNNSSDEYYSIIKKNCEEKLNDETDLAVIEFYHKNIFKLIHQ
jgi:hypothetical protein